MRRFQEELSGWGKGVMATETTPDRLPNDASPRARNAAWSKLGYPTKRKGLNRLTTTAQAGKNPILGLDNFNGMNWTIDSAGRWSKVNSDGTFSPIDAGRTTPFVASDFYPSTAIAANLLFAVNGTNSWKTNGTTVTKFGIDAPAAPTATDSGVAGNPTGTYRIAITAYNENTGHESSRSVESVVTVAAKKIHVVWTFPTDTQVTKVRVHIFKDGLTDRYFRLAATNVSVAPDALTGGYPVATLAIDINVLDSDINNLIVASPTMTENNPPPVGTRFIAYHGSRMFATDGKTLYYSKIGDPESFDPNQFESVNYRDGQSIIGFQTIVEHHLVIWKTQSTHILTGPDDPNTWEVNEIDPTVGLASPRGIIATEGGIWWVALQGLFSIQFNTLTGSVGIPARMDSPNISDRFEDLLTSALGTSTALYHASAQRLYFAIPEQGKTRNTIIVPYNMRYKLWEDIWDPMDVSSFGTFMVNGSPVPVIGGYAGRVFQLWTLPYVDGVRQTDGAGVNFTLKGMVTGVTEQTGFDHVDTRVTSSASDITDSYIPTGPNEWMVLFAADRAGVDPIFGGSLVPRSLPGAGASMTLGDSGMELPSPGGGVALFNWFTQGYTGYIKLGLKPTPGNHIAFDAASALNYGATNNFSHTSAGGTDNVLLVAVRDDLALTSTTVTYNGVAMSKIASFILPPGYGYSMWALQNPAAGAHNVVITGPPNMSACSASYTKVNGINALNSLTDSTAVFDTTGDALIEIPVVVITPSGLANRNVIIGNTGTVLVLRDNWQLVPQIGWKYYIGSPNFEFDTKHMHPTSVPQTEGSVFMSRTWKEILVKGYTDTVSSNFEGYTILDGDIALANALRLIIPITAGGAVFDVDLFDVGKFGVGKVVTNHQSLGLNGRTLGIRLRNIQPGEGILLLGLGVFGTELNHKG